MNRQKERKEKKCRKIIDLTLERKNAMKSEAGAFINKWIIELVYNRKPVSVCLACQTQIHYEQIIIIIIIIILAINKFPPLKTLSAAINFRCD